MKTYISLGLSEYEEGPITVDGSVLAESIKDAIETGIDSQSGFYIPMNFDEVLDGLDLSEEELDAVSRRNPGYASSSENRTVEWVKAECRKRAYAYYRIGEEVEGYEYKVEHIILEVENGTVIRYPRTGW